MFCTILVESLFRHVYVFIFNFINFFIEIEFHTIHVYWKNLKGNDNVEAGIWVI